jgi:hypothetical protein
MSNTRVDLARRLNGIAPNGRGVEVGVFMGQYSREILEVWGGTLYMVDVWRPLGEEYKDYSNMENHSEAYAETMGEIKGMEDRGIMIRSTSKVASEIFPDESLDFVYIDANHAYDFVKEDIGLWYPKVKKGGILSGHDYIAMDWYGDPYFLPNGKDKEIYTEGGNRYHGTFGVNTAVDEFCREYRYKMNVTEELFGSWWIKK